MMKMMSPNLLFCSLMLMVGVSSIASADSIVEYDRFDDPIPFAGTQATPLAAYGKIIRLPLKSAQREDYLKWGALSALVNPEGVAVAVEVVRSTGFPKLDEQALQAARHAAYPSATWTRFEIPVQLFSEKDNTLIQEVKNVKDNPNAFIPPPVYPADLESLAEEGRVVVIALVDAGGKILETGVAESSGRVGFDNAAVEAVRKGLFYNKKITYYRIPFRFSLSCASCQNDK